MDAQDSKLDDFVSTLFRRHVWKLPKKSPFPVLWPNRIPRLTARPAQRPAPVGAAPVAAARVARVDYLMLSCPTRFSTAVIPAGKSAQPPNNHPNSSTDINLGGQQSNLRKADLEELVKTSHFGEQEINQLYQHFRQIASRDGTITAPAFKEALGLQDNLFADRIFLLFDTNRNGTLDFREFIQGLSVLGKRGTMEEKLRFSFRVYDFDGDGTIDSAELCKILKASFLSGEGMTDEQLRLAVDAMFADADSDGNGHIDFEEYRTLMLKHPAIIRAFQGSNTGSSIASPASGPSGGRS
ncbi:putative calcineurin B [Paratrimastix pyriformis]|uniref:Calcineurin B n=1 Tax=Paratrimastix pyriformis TaxID=342808 RepID=A0ABQ8UNT1_9EUKA|nr:putative calcineurin B [Paratrimastix pyriformis]